jgi:cyclohexyl-isocyanide hydratase
MSTPFPVVFALYPHVTQLDFTGPFEVFARLPAPGVSSHRWRADGLHGDGGIVFADVARLRDIPECALLCVPGGFGTVAAMEDLVLFSRASAPRCHGALCYFRMYRFPTPGGAGLLVGKRAACHWAWRESLSVFGVTPDPARVVRDGNVITGGGVTAGIDMALTVMAEIAGVDYAQTVQLAIEYDPVPPFACGRPERARPEIVAAARSRLDAISKERDSAVLRAATSMTRTATVAGGF